MCWGVVWVKKYIFTNLVHIFWTCSCEVIRKRLVLLSRAGWGSFLPFGIHLVVLSKLSIFLSWTLLDSPGHANFAHTALRLAFQLVNWSSIFRAFDFSFPELSWPQVRYMLIVRTQHTGCHFIFWYTLLITPLLQWYVNSEKHDDPFHRDLTEGCWNNVPLLSSLEN